MNNPSFSGHWLRTTRLSDVDPVEVIDCTLRDGEQAPGVWFTTEQKVELAGMLSDAGVDVLDAGFPVSGFEEIDAIRKMRRAGVSARIGGTARLFARDIEAARESGAEVIFLFAPVSDIQFERTLNLDRRSLLSLFVDCAQRADLAGLEVSLVFGDATQADTAFVQDLASRCETLPVRRLILCDSMGAAIPSQMASLVRAVQGAAPTHRLCVHCHNDFGMATANTVAALDAGASGFTATVNGIGERAGNADLAEVLASVTFLLKREHRVDPTRLRALSRTVERMTGIHNSPLKPVTGMNVYRHESGIHVNAILKEPTSYQSLPPAWTNSEMELVLGKHSGATQVQALLRMRNLPHDSNTVRCVVDALKRCRNLCNRDQLEEALVAVEGFRKRVLGGIPIDTVLEVMGDEFNAKLEVG